MPALTCPGCKAEMTESTSGGLSVDVCPSCSGLWLDRDEFEKLGGELPKGGVCYGGDRRCPRCDAPMEIRPSKVAELDLCPHCKGMYLDKAELNLLVRVAQVAAEDLARVEPPRPARRPEAPKKTASDDRFSKITNKTTEPRFVCAECRQPRPMSEQVIGARSTICTGCAGLKHIESDPVARRQAELAKAKPAAPRPAPAPAKPAPSPARATPADDDDIVSDLLFGRKRKAGSDFDVAASGLVDLIHHLLK
ncbi:MAG TPA: zf-TFIIB domain-containing protein [Myxococcales bacterium]|jgi:Zn-finger nucleic acid-binding protein